MISPESIYTHIHRQEKWTQCAIFRYTYMYEYLYVYIHTYIRNNNNKKESIKLRKQAQKDLEQGT